MEELSPITPVNFFQLAVKCRYMEIGGEFPRLSGKNSKAHLLPTTSALCHEENFADLSMGWNEEGFEFLIQVNKDVEDARFPDITTGDSAEFFIDTRDVKTSGYNTRFCHHFFFLPEAVDGRQAGEITHFRTEDAHPLCDSSLLQVKSVLKKGSYQLHCHIPKNCLVGYDPKQFERIGFSYRINRPYWESQHFSVVTADYRLEQQPSLWSSMRLIR